MCSENKGFLFFIGLWIMGKVLLFWESESQVFVFYWISLQTVHLLKEISNSLEEVQGCSSAHVGTSVCLYVHEAALFFQEDTYHIRHAKIFCYED